VFEQSPVDRRGLDIQTEDSEIVAEVEDVERSHADSIESASPRLGWSSGRLRAAIAGSPAPRRAASDSRVERASGPSSNRVQLGPLTRLTRWPPRMPQDERTSLNCPRIPLRSTSNHTRPPWSPGAIVCYETSATRPTGSGASGSGSGQSVPTRRNDGTVRSLAARARPRATGSTSGGSEGQPRPGGQPPRKWEGPGPEMRPPSRGISCPGLPYFFLGLA
jgi:hypothetical protein